MKSVARTDIGRVRSINQDVVMVLDESDKAQFNLYIVADGMGGAKTGDLHRQPAVVSHLRFKLPLIPCGIAQHHHQPPGAAAQGNGFQHVAVDRKSVV